MKAKDPLTGTQAAGSFLLHHRKGQKGSPRILNFLSFQIAAIASSLQGEKQSGDLERNFSEREW